MLLAYLRHHALDARWTIVLAFCLAFAAPAVGRAEPPGSGKRDAALQRVAGGLVRVIVRTQPGQSAAVAQRLRARGRSVLRTHSLIDAVTATLPAEDLAVLEADPAVAGLSLDAVVASTSDTVASARPREANTLAATLGLPIGDLTGKGVGIAIVDSGVEPNADFPGLRNYDFTGRGVADEFGHGTHVAGLIAGRGTPSQGAYAGVAPRAHLVSLKVLDAEGRGLTSAVIEALEFAVLNRDALGIAVVNLSLGHPILEPAATDPLVQAVEAAVRAGLVVVVAAGNIGLSPATGLPGYAGILSPGNAPSAITVGSLDTRQTPARSDDDVAPYSSRGPTWYDARPKPDLVAPGHDLVSRAPIGSTLYAGLPDRQVAGAGGVSRWLRLSGTSMATGVTSGTAALLIEAVRGAGRTPTPETVKAILAFTALPLPAADVLTQGHGAINPSGAVSLVAALAASGWPEIDAVELGIPPATTVAGETWTWAQALLWRTTVVWGNAGDLAAPWWAQTVVWGNVDWADGTLSWNSTVVWGNTVVWGSADIGR